VWRLVRRVRHRVNNRLPARRIDGITGPVHRNDTMLRATGRDRYERTGQETIALFADRAAAAGIDPDGATWFEIGCGHGRLIRALTARVDAGRVLACDIDPTASAFCARAFGVRRVLSDASFRFDPDVDADIVYALSVATHLPWAGFERFLAASFASVAPGGVLLFTTHGDVAMGQVGVYDAGAYLPLAGQLRADYDSDGGFAYVPYAFEPDAGYGMAWHRWEAIVPRVQAAAGGAAAVDVVVEEAAVEGHQDLWICRLTS
jgi:SAM-dependent methyltransferase